MSATTTDSSCTEGPFDHAKAHLQASFSVRPTVWIPCIQSIPFPCIPFFESLSDVPQPVEENGDQGINLKDGLAVIPVAEDSKTLDSLLCFCYLCTLVDDPNTEVSNDAMNVLAAVGKYSLDGIEKQARRAIINPKTSLCSLLLICCTHSLQICRF